MLVYTFLEAFKTLRLRKKEATISRGELRVIRAEGCQLLFLL
jgi:hypothetical protein